MAAKGENNGRGASPARAGQTFHPAATLCRSQADSPKSRPSGSINRGRAKRVVRPATAEPGDGEARELRQSDDAGKQEYDIYAMQVLATPVAERRPQFASGFDRRSGRVPMAQQMNRIILRDADQREAKRQRDAMNGPKQRADSGRAPPIRRSPAARRSTQRCRHGDRPRATG